MQSMGRRGRCSPWGGVAGAVHGEAWQLQSMGRRDSWSPWGGMAAAVHGEAWQPQSMGGMAAAVYGRRGSRSPWEVWQPQFMGRCSSYSPWGSVAGGMAAAAVQGEGEERQYMARSFVFRTLSKIIRESADTNIKRLEGNVLLVAGVVSLLQSACH